MIYNLLFMSKYINDGKMIIQFFSTDTLKMRLSVSSWNYWNPFDFLSSYDRKRFNCVYFPKMSTNGLSIIVCKIALFCWLKLLVKKCRHFEFEGPNKALIKIFGYCNNLQSNVPSFPCVYRVLSKLIPQSTHTKTASTTAKFDFLFLIFLMDEIRHKVLCWTNFVHVIVWYFATLLLFKIIIFSTSGFAP